MNKELKTNREVKLIPSRTYMYAKLKAPGVLIECGFLSNAQEKSLLIQTDYQKKLAKIIVEGLKEINF